MRKLLTLFSLGANYICGTFCQLLFGYNPNWLSHVYDQTTYEQYQTALEILFNLKKKPIAFYQDDVLKMWWPESGFVIEVDQDGIVGMRDSLDDLIICRTSNFDWIYGTFWIQWNNAYLHK